MDNDLVDRGIAALEAGNKALARRLLGRAIVQGVNDERTWLAMSGAVEDVAQATDCLRRVLAINPGNQHARQRLDQLAASASTPASETHPAEAPPSTARQPAPQRRGAGLLPGEGSFYLFVLAWTLIWIGGHGVFLAFGIRSYAAERSPSDLWLIAIPALCILGGLLVIWAIWSQQRTDRRAVLETAASQTRLFGRTPQAADSSADQGALRCEKCGRPLGLALLDCPYRTQGTCPYRVEYPTVRRRGLYKTLLILGSAVALFGLLLACPVLSLIADENGSVLCPVGLCATPLGLLAVVIGGLALFGEQLTVTNSTTGQMLQRHRVNKFTTYQATASALQPIAFPPQLRRPMRIPASICALYEGQSATHVFYMALLSLLSQRSVTLQWTMTSRTYLGIKVPPLSGRCFVLAPGTSPSPSQAAGELEKRILHGVGEWSQRKDENIRSRGIFRRRTFRHFLALEDLLYVVFEGEHSSPDYWLTHRVVGADAAQRGLGRMVGPLKARFEPLPEHRESVLTEYDVILEVHRAFKASQPGIASDLWANIKKHIERLDASDS